MHVDRQARNITNNRIGELVSLIDLEFLWVSKLNILLNNFDFNWPTISQQTNTHKKFVEIT